MNIVTRKHLLDASAQYPDAAKELQAWYKVAAFARWRNFIEIKQTFKDADAVGDYVVFDIRQNRYRLIVIVHYSRLREERLTEGHIYIRSVLTHKRYIDKTNWNKGVSQ